MQKKLILLPGSTDINYKDNRHNYSKRYNLVSNEALKRGYLTVEVLSWVGQNSGLKGVMNLSTATEFLKLKICEIEKENSLYDIIAFSWGANVILKALYDFQKAKINLGYLNKVVLWGPDEFWRMAKYFQNEIATADTIRALKQKGAIIQADFMKHELSNEFLLSKYEQSIKLKICIGEKDTKSNPAFLDYLKGFVNNKYIFYSMIEGVDHIVEEYNKAYIDCLFKD